MTFTLFRRAASILGLASAMALSASPAGAQSLPTLDGRAPIVIAHRGASGYLPEHTLAAYELAIKMGADYIEPDLQLTSDGALVAIHDDTLNRTTNVATLFAPRNGGYKVSDFTLAEVRTLTVVPPAGGTAQNSHPGFTPTHPELRVPTFQEVIDLARQQGAALGRTVGIYPEAKQADPVMEDGILATLQANGYGTGGASADMLYVQSFSDLTLRSIATKQSALGLDMPLVLLGAAVTLPDGSAQVGVLGAGGALSLLTMADVASFADGIGMVINYGAAPITTSFIAQAHAAGLAVHGWTFGKSDPVLAAAEYQRYLEMGMDGVFSNYPDLAAAAVAQFAAPVPEPSTAAMMIMGAVGVMAAVRRKRKANDAARDGNSAGPILQKTSI
jgi:glycerophosphoryl diester phosphodiesterase